VLAENSSLGRFDALRSRATPLVGRDNELALLSRHWAEAEAGNGRVVLIAGEPGIGKSRLVEALAERISAERHVRLEYFCSPHHQGSALYPVVAEMARGAGFQRDDSPSQRRAKLEAHLASAGSRSSDAALIAELHGLPAAEPAQRPDISPQRRKERTFEALLRYIEGFTQRVPVLVVFEDIHWIDPSSGELLELAAARISRCSLLLIATLRPDTCPGWTHLPYVTTLSLPRLQPEHAAAMVAGIAGGKPLSAAAVERIVERSDGVPLFVEEVTKTVLEAEGPGQAAASTTPLSVPTALKTLLIARLDRLGREAKDVAQRGAVIGRKFGYELLQLISDWPEPKLRTALLRLTDAGLLFARGKPPHSSYLFKHALVQDAAYGMLLRTRRRELHARTASVLEQQFPEVVVAQPEALAHHLTEAGLGERAVAYWLKAGDQALSRSAMTEAEALLRKGLSLIPLIPDGAPRWHSELQLQIALGRTLMASQGYSARAMGEAYDRARVLCQQLNRPSELWAVLVGQHSYRQDRAELDAALALATELEELGEREGNATARFTGCRLRGWTSLLTGDFITARALLEQSLSLYDPGQPQIYPELGAPFGALPTLLGHLSWSLALLGDLDQAQERNEAAIAEARRLAHAPTLANALSVSWRLGWLIRSDPANLLETADQLHALSTDYGLSYWLVMSMVWRGWSLAALGHSEEGVSLMTKAFIALSERGAAIYRPRILTLLAEVHGMAGRPEAGLGHLDELDRSAEGKQVRWCAAESCRIRGTLLAQRGDVVAAEARFLEAIACARHQAAKLFELRAATSLARLWSGQGRQDAASALLAPLCDSFTEGFAARDLLDACELMTSGPQHDANRGMLVQ
jgi:tetratricopeptide (TPR) repeat protein